MSVIKLEIFTEHCILHYDDGEKVLIEEGKQTSKAKARWATIKQKLINGYLESLIENAISNPNQPLVLDEKHRKLLDKVANSVTSETGRAMMGLTILQLCVKSICVQQNIRLHKGGSRSCGFSWKEGISMRTLDSHFITPVLRNYGLLNLNKYGLFMTRSLAENYPYSELYKATIRGAKKEWAELVNVLETEHINAFDALKFVIIALHNRSVTFKKETEACLVAVNNLVRHEPVAEDIILLISQFIEQADYSARIFEIAIHALFQVLEEENIFEGDLKPLSQMRSANKKHGNIADIEILAHPNSLQILEAYDAKYGKPYLRDELEELADKLETHPETNRIEFIVNQSPDLREEITERMNELKEFYDCQINIIEFSNWINKQLERSFEDRDSVARRWLIVLSESICQHRRQQAPIDEPCHLWVTQLKEICQGRAD